MNEKQPVKLRSKKPYTCRREVMPGKVCAAYLTEQDGDVCADHVNVKTGELKPLIREQAAPEIVTPKAHWPFWP